MDQDNSNVYCISLRVRRTTVEDAYVNVPVTDAVMKPTGEGTFGIDVDAFAAEGIRLSQDPRVEWQTESSTTECHPIQQPKPENRKVFDIHYLDSDRSDSP